jgi:hypothetical protein
MDDRMAAAVREGFGDGDPGYSAYRTGQAAFAAAERLRHADELAAGRLLLLRASVVQLSRATLARDGSAPGPLPSRPGGADFELGCSAVRAAERLRGLDGSEQGVALLYEEASALFA